MSRRLFTLAAAPIAALALMAGIAGVATAQTTTTTVPAPKTDDKVSANGVTRVILGVAQPLNAPGQTLLLQDVRIAPGAQLAQHYHQGTQLARVVKGTLTYSLDEGTAIVTKKGGSPETVSAPKTISLQPGDVLVENAGLLHHAANKGKTAVVLNLTALIQTGAPLATPAGTGAGTGTGATQLEVTADLQSQSKLTHTVGASNEKTYGWNDLVGTATVDGQPVAVDLQGTVDYTNGSGPFGEFVTFTFADGSVLATRMQGAATAATDGATTFEATMSVIGGTGKYATATGSGVFTGSRTGDLGAPVQVKFALALAG
ncbi:MAG: cupin domain-containing protein [Acidimicrobiia bacterium]